MLFLSVTGFIKVFCSALSFDSFSSFSDAAFLRLFVRF